MFVKKSERILTSNQEAILSGEKSVTFDAKRKNLGRARKRTGKALKKLASIAMKYPEAISDKDLTELIDARLESIKSTLIMKEKLSPKKIKRLNRKKNTLFNSENLFLNTLKHYLSQEEFTISKIERTVNRLPNKLGRKRIPTSIKHGNLREKKHGSLLMKKHGLKMDFIYKLLEMIYQNLGELHFVSPNSGVLLEIENYENEKITLEWSNLARWAANYIENECSGFISWVEFFVKGTSGVDLSQNQDWIKNKKIKEKKTEELINSKNSTRIMLCVR